MKVTSMNIRRSQPVISTRSVQQETAARLAASQLCDWLPKYLASYEGSALIADLRAGLKQIQGRPLQPHSMLYVGRLMR